MLKSKNLLLQGKASDHIWLMEDGEEPWVIGVRMDSGDSGTVYLTREQAKDLSEQDGVKYKPGIMIYNHPGPCLDENGKNRLEEK